MKNILYIELCNFENYPLGGHLSFALHLTTAMQGDIDLAGIRTDRTLAEGEWHDVDFCGSTYHFYNIKNVSVAFSRPLVPARVKDFFRVRKHIRKILSHKDYYIVIVQTPEVLFAMPESYLSRVCLISPGVGNPLSISRYGFAHAFAGLYDSIFFRRAAKVNVILPAADSKAIEDYLRRSKGKLSGTRVVQFPTRYDAEIFKPLDKLAARSALGLPASSIIAVTTGRLNWYKGWKLMIDAFALFASRMPDSFLYFIGKGEDEQKIKDYAAYIGLADKVVLAGVHPLPTVAEYLNAADVFIMGSMTEGWSTSLVEAVACAKPCVVTDFSSAAELVQNGRNGFVLCERDEIKFADAMQAALALNSDTLSDCAAQASEMSVQCMRWKLNNILNFE